MVVKERGYLPSPSEKIPGQDRADVVRFIHDSLDCIMKLKGGRFLQNVPVHTEICTYPLSLPV